MSVLFKDGPARDVTLTLARAPFFLRVTERKTGGRSKWDALDLLEDEPEPDEVLHVSRLGDRPIRGMIDGAKYRGPFLAAWYVLHEPQPKDHEVRTQRAWREWTERNAAAFREANK